MAESKDITAEHARTAAEFNADVSVEHIAGVYAKALLETTERAGTTSEVLGEFDAFISEIVDCYPKLETVMASVLVSPDDKSNLLDRILQGKASAVFINFLKVVAHHGRLDCLRAIHRETLALNDKLRGRIPVRLSTATPLSDAAIAHIADRIRAKLGGEPIFQQETNPDLIGGIVLRIGDTVYDGSIANQLHNLREEMIDRSAHEIQSRRDRFRNPAGN